VSNVRIVPILIAIAGVVLLAGGASGYVIKSGSTVVCEACGMEVARDDVSTEEVVAEPSGQTHWACCPVCAMVVSMYYENATLKACCFGCGENITCEFVCGNLTSTSPSGGTYNVTMVFGMACAKNKFVCSNQCADQVRTEYEWANGLPTKTMSQTFSTAESKYSQFTVGYKSIQIPTVALGLVVGGVVLLFAAPLEWRVVERKKTVKGE
jgi:hypothetical protein